MMDTFEPWLKYSPLEKERLTTIAKILQTVRHEAVLLHEPAAGDNEWSLGCRVYARECHAVRSAVEKHPWLTVLTEAEPLRFTFAIGTVPIRFYRGGASDAPGHYVERTFAELHQQQLAFRVDGLRLVDRVLRMAVEIDPTGEVEDVILVEMDTAGNVTETYRIPLDGEAGKVTPLRPKPVELGPPQVEPLAAEESEPGKKNDRNVGSR
ncbi:MAG: hypothetical protein ACRD8A_06235 [Candidatus Acidiferrales bacterium]